MVAYPISVPRKHYSGRNPARIRAVADWNFIAGELEKHINEIVKNQEDEHHSYLYYEIARETGYDIKTVADILYSVDCGSNGFTVKKV